MNKHYITMAIFPILFTATIATSMAGQTNKKPSYKIGDEVTWRHNYKDYKAVIIELRPPMANIQYEDVSYRVLSDAEREASFALARQAPNVIMPRTREEKVTVQTRWVKIKDLSP